MRERDADLSAIAESKLWTIFFIVICTLEQKVDLDTKGYLLSMFCVTGMFFSLSLSSYLKISYTFIYLFIYLFLYLFVFSYENPLLFSSFKFCESSATVSFFFQKSYCKHILVIVQFHWDPFPSFLLNRVKKLRPVKENKRSAATTGLNQIYLNMPWKRKVKHKIAKWKLNQSLFII